MHDRVENAVNVLRKMAEDHKQPGLVHISGQIITISPKPDKDFWNAIYLLSFLWLFGVGAIISSFIKFRLDLISVLTIPVTVCFGFFFVNITRRLQIISVDLLNKQFIFEPVRKIFDWQRPLRIDFARVDGVVLKLKREGRGMYWRRLSFLDERGKRLNSMVFGDQYPENVIADSTYQFLQMVLESYNQSPVATHS
jgi:hypothetical protein